MGDNLWQMLGDGRLASIHEVPQPKPDACSYLKGCAEATLKVFYFLFLLKRKVIATQKRMTFQIVRSHI